MMIVTMNKEEGKMKNKLIVTIGAIIGVVIIGFGVYQTNASQSSPKLSSEDIQQIVKDQYPGTITEIELEKKFNNYVYEVEIEEDGKEYELKLDADTGEILKLEERFIEKEQMALGPNNKEVDQQDENANDKTENKAEDKKESKQNTKKSDHQNMIDAKEAIKIALNEFSGTVKEVELDKEDGRLIYEIEIVSGNNEAEIEIDVYTKEFVKNKRKKTSKNYDQQTVISATEALDIALNKFTGTVKGLELEKDDGRLIYEIEIADGHKEAEIEIDAYTGEVLVIEIDTD